jgi:scyllo-inositol 2-dehydrogenase (NADP+)
MRAVVIGLGIQGKKRLKFAGNDIVATVDSAKGKADYQKIQDVPLESYEAALVCTPDEAKLPILKFLLASGKHALVEKPLLALEAGPIEELRDLCETRRVTCYTAYNHRFEPHIVRLKEVLDQNRVGPVYLVKFFYGNGTAYDVRQSEWRDQGLGVITDLGSHLFDMALFLFGNKDLRLKAWRLDAFENKAYDYAMIASTGKPAFQFEMTLLSWKNTFRIDVFGASGSAHINGLCKWGPSTLEIRKRVLPSGRPTEESKTLESADPTWEKEYAYFKELCASGKNNLDNDLRIQSLFSQLAEPV